ncbi:MAG: asparaginase domain-containing protein [Paracoccus sp.]|nr:asparaginase domain-containing protein [Paracoccus sp. (in: a-proteobacteria)]
MRICIINTGGTISSIGKPLAPMPAARFAEAVDRLLGPSLTAAMPWARIHFDTGLHFDSPTGTLDSSEVRPEDWCRMVGRILDLHEDFDAFVILHGTDTMDFTAAALPLLLNVFDARGRARAGLAAPVILTGAQLPLFRESAAGLVLNAGSDGFANLCGALEAARLGIAGVTILFDGTLMRGNRALKVSTRDFAAFETPHAAPLARTGMAMPAVSDAPADRARPIDAGLIRAQLDAIRAALDDHPVVELPCVPIQPAGLMAGMIDDLVARGVRGIVLAGFGAGNVPSDRGLTGQAIRRAGAAGVLVVIASRPIRGAVGDFDYAAGAWIAGTGAVPGGDATPVALVAKATILSAAAGHHGWDAAVVRALMARGLAGERG